MLKKLILALAAASAALGASSAALAHDRDGDRSWRRGHYEHQFRERRFRHYAPRRVVVVPAPRVVYAPPPRVAYRYLAAPVVVRPAVIRSAPVYSAPGVSIRFDFPL